MKKTGREELDRAHYLLTRWAEWRIRLEGNELGRSRETIEAKLARDGGAPSGKPAGSIVPTTIYCSETVSQVDQAVGRMPWCLYSVVVHKYLLPGLESDRVDAWTATEGGSPAEYYRQWEAARWWVAALVD